MRSVLLSLIAASLLAGCAPRLSSPVQLLEARSITTFDFSPYLRQGFLFLPEAYAGEHESLGYIELRFSPSTADLVRRQAWDETGGWGRGDSRVAPLVQQLYETAAGLGADAVSHLRVDVARDNVGAPSYTLSGYAIRRTTP